MNNTRTLGLLALLAFALLFPLLFSNPAVTTIAVFSVILMAAATGWNLFSGYTRYLSLGHAAFYGLGAYTLALVCQAWHVPGGLVPFLLLPVVGLIVALCSLPLGWIALRTRRHTFMVITIAIFWLTSQFPHLLNGIIPNLSGLALPIPTWSGDVFNLPFYYTALILLLFSLGISWWIRCSKFGLSLLAIGDDEDRTRGLGVKTDLCKLVAFVISATIVGMAGALNAYFLGFLSPSSAFDRSFNIAVPLMAFLGGVGTVMGPLVGAVFTAPIQQYLTFQYGGVQGLDLIFYGVLLLIVILFMPEGISLAAQRYFSVWMVSYNKTNRDKMQLIASHDILLAPSVLPEPMLFHETTRNVLPYTPLPESLNMTDSYHPHTPLPEQPITPNVYYPAGPLSPKGLTQKVRAQRLVIYPQNQDVLAPSPATPSSPLPPVSSFCPRCNEVLWVWDGVQFCTHCKLTRSYVQRASSPSFVPHSAQPR